MTRWRNLLRIGLKKKFNNQLNKLNKKFKFKFEF